MTILRLHLFGGLMMSWDGTPLPPIAGTVARSQFAHLRTYRDQPHTCHLPAGTFWPDLPDDLAHRRLSQALGQIRKVLNPHPILLTEGDTVQIPPPLPPWLDALEDWLLDQGGPARKRGGNDARPPSACVNQHAAGASWITSN